MAEEADRSVRLSDLLGLEQSIGTKIEAKIVAQHAETRRHFDVMAKHLRTDLNKVIDKVNATNDKVDRLMTRHAIEHTAFVDAVADHEVRQRVLERIVEPPTTDNS
jgi:hypothetical protein